MEYSCLTWELVNNFRVGSVFLIFELEQLSNRARPYPEQNLPTEFHVKEHSKPLFIINKILNLKNLYFHHCANEAFKILKFRSPILVHN